MKKCLTLLFILPFLVHAQTFQGIWAGTLEIQGTQMRIVFHIDYKDGKYSSTMDSPDQFVNGIPMDSTTFESGILKVSSNSMREYFEGKIKDSSTAFVGYWYQSGLKLSITLRKTNYIPEIKRPQTPQKPYPYTEKEVEFKNEKAGIILKGTFTYPEQKEAFPVVVLISGSGPQNRDEELFGHKPFLVIADFLTRNGIGVLRFDDRGTAASEGDFSTATSVDFASDVMAAVEFLKAQKNVIKDRIGLIGHSEGGIIAPMVAAEMPDIFFIILLAGPGTTGKEILIDQTRLILQANGGKNEYIERVLKQNIRWYDMVIQSKNIDKTRKKIYNEMKKVLTKEMKDYPDVVENQAKAQSEMLCSPWFRFFLTYDPKTALQKLKCHVLVLNGSLDLQVPAQKNVDAIMNALKDAGNYQAESKIFNGLNHLFQTANTGSPNEYGKIEETISVEVLESMKSWMIKKMRYN